MWVHGFEHRVIVIASLILGILFIGLALAQEQQEVPSPASSSLSLDEEEEEWGEKDVPATSSSLDNEEEEWEEGEEELAEAEEAAWNKGRFTFRHEWAYHTEDPARVVINRPSLRLQWEQLIASRYFVLFDGKMAYNMAYDYWDSLSEIERRYRFQKQVREFFVQSHLGKTSYKLGNQIVVWGEADGAVVTDVISPRDLTEFIFTPIEDARIGQVMLTIDHYRDSGQWTLVLNPDPQVNRLARPGHAYALPSLAVQPGFDVKEEKKPIGSLTNMEVGIRWKKTMGQSDISVMAADLINDNPVYKSEGINAREQLVLQPEYHRYQMLGSAANWAQGNFLWKGEIAVKRNRTFNRNNLLEEDGLIERNVIDTALGMEYDANGVYLVSLEIANQRLINWTKSIAQVRQDEGVFYLNLSKNFLHETLKPQYTVSYQIQDQETVHLARTNYEIDDRWTWKVEGVYFDARKNDSLLGIFRRKHRFSTEIEYHF